MSKITDNTGDGPSAHFVPVKKMDDEQQMIWGEVYAPFVLDTYGEFMTPHDIRLMQERFMRLDLSKVIDTNHDNLPNESYPVESFIARAGDPDFTEGAWVLGVKVADDYWPKVKSGELNGYSFQAMVKPVECEVVYSVLRDHVGSTEKADDHEHVYFVEVNADGQVVGGRTDEVNGHSHQIRRASVTEATDEHTHRFFL